MFLAAEKIRTVSGDEKSPPSKPTQPQLAKVSQLDRQNTSSDEDLTLSEDSGLTTAEATKSLEESIKSPTSMQSGKAEDTVRAPKTAVATPSAQPGPDASLVGTDRQMSSESEERASSVRSGQRLTSGDADNEDTTSGDARQGHPRPQHSHPKHPGRRYHASPKLTALQQGKTSSESEETELDSVFYTERSESSQRTSDDTDEHALKYMDSRKEETGTSAQISLSFPRPLPKVLEDVAMGPGGRFSDDYLPPTGSTSYVSRSGHKIIIASPRALSVEESGPVSSSTTATQTDEQVAQIPRPEESKIPAIRTTPVDAPQSTSGPKMEGQVKTSSRLEEVQPLVETRGPFPEGIASRSGGALSPEETTTQSEGLTSEGNRHSVRGNLFARRNYHSVGRTSFGGNCHSVRGDLIARRNCHSFGRASFARGYCHSV